MVTLLPIEPRNEQHGALIVAAFNNLFINRGGQSDGSGDGYGDGSGYGDGYGDGTGYGYGTGGGYGDGTGKFPEEWLVGP